LAAWPATCRVEVGGLGQILFCHATPRNDTDIFTRATREERLLPIFKDVDASIVVCGHTHMQFDRPVAGVRILNAGSVGMPFEQPSGEYWLLPGPDVQLRRTGDNLASAAARIRATDYPRVEELPVRYVLRPPTEAESLEMFAAAELR
jgi:predicted phosphodiesterase